MKITVKGVWAGQAVDLVVRLDPAELRPGALRTRRPRRNMGKRLPDPCSWDATTTEPPRSRGIRNDLSV